MSNRLILAFDLLPLVPKILVKNRGHSFFVTLRRTSHRRRRIFPIKNIKNILKQKNETKNLLKNNNKTKKINISMTLYFICIFLVCVFVILFFFFFSKIKKIQYFVVQ